MTEKLAKKISLYFVEIGVTKKEDIDIVAFGLFHIIADTTQILILLILGLLTKSVISVFLFTVFYGAIKRYCGGYHLNKHYLCVVVYTSIVLVAILLSRNLALILMPWGNIVIALLTFVLIFLKSPVPHPNSPHTKKKLKLYRKKSIINSLIELTLITIASLFFVDANINIYITSATYGGLLASITLLIPINIFKPKGGDSNDYAK